jgi:hypothetical protein
LLLAIMGSPLPRSAGALEAATGVVEDLGGDGQVVLRRRDVLVTHVRGEGRQAGLHVDALGVPATEAVHREGVPQIVQTGATAAASGLEAARTQELAADRADGHDRVRVPAMLEEPRVRGSGPATHGEWPECLHDVAGDRHQPGLEELGLADEQRAGREVDVSHAQTHRLRQPEPSGVEEEQQSEDRPRPIGAARAYGQLEGCAQQRADLLLGEDERHVPRNMRRPEGAVLPPVGDEGQGLGPPAVETELPHDVEACHTAYGQQPRAVGHPGLEDGDRQITRSGKAPHEEGVEVAKDLLGAGELASQRALEREVAGEVRREAAAKRMGGAHGRTSFASRATP